jgi:hypothetical protein
VRRGLSPFGVVAAKQAKDDTLEGLSLPTAAIGSVMKNFIDMIGPTMFAFAVSPVNRRVSI